MSHNLVEVESFPTNVVVVNPGELVKAADLETACGALADRTQFLSKGGRKGVFPRSIPFIPVFNSTRWTLGGDMQVTTLAGNDGGLLGHELYLPFKIPHQATIVEFGVRLKGAAGHGAFPGGKPANMPTVQLRSRKMDTTLVSLVALGNDGSGSNSAYQGYHIVQNTGSWVTDTLETTGYHYYLAVTNEHGANSIDAGLTVYSAFVGYVDGKD